ncbi:hypothetical protein PS645_04930 [Pseudomonas fluorescens]|uniref:Uncharacterized protein n=1 Tax=Pseudomonas fluorescens TaxID=294 RepID=A0A5E6WWQ1_PSEFL|nr:hypothetical protein PS645_04930 [Pseudomonas fluorescens]
MLREEVALFTAGSVNGRRLIQRIAAQHHQHGRDPIADAFAEIAGLEGGSDHLIDDHRTLRIGQAIFQAITDFDAQLAIIASDDQQCAVVLVFLADTPVTSELITEVGDVGTLQIRQRYHDQLLARGFFVGTELLIQLLAHRGFDHLGVVDDPPGQLRKLQLGLRRHCKHPEQQHQAHFQHAHMQPRPCTHIKAFPRFTYLA